MALSLINKITEKIILKELKKISHKDVKVLDLGCGDGRLSLKLKKMGFEVYATDIVSDPFKNKDNIRYSQLNFNEGLKYPKNFFDIVISMEVIEHIENPWGFIDEIYGLIKPNGKLILSTPNVENYISRLLYLVSKRFVSFGPDLSYWNKTKNIVIDKHKTPIFHVFFKEMIYQKFNIEKHISNGVFPLFNLNTHYTNPNIGISKIYILKKNEK
jgi:2-polyprenyl-3-methyl-5-hydroxy-6-metoxy-1,4-benzoquinol methylase